MFINSNLSKSRVLPPTSSINGTEYFELNGKNLKNAFLDLVLKCYVLAFAYFNISLRIDTLDGIRSIDKHRS